MLCWSLWKLGHGLKVISSANKQASPHGAVVFRESQTHAGFASDFLIVFTLTDRGKKIHHNQSLSVIVILFF